MSIRKFVVFWLVYLLLFAQSLEIVDVPVVAELALCEIGRFFGERIFVVPRISLGVGGYFPAGEHLVLSLVASGDLT